MGSHNIAIISQEAEQLINDIDAMSNLKEHMQNGDLKDWALSNPRLPNHINFDTGATRMVFWDRTKADYVFKINLAPETPSCIDYNANEQFVYQEACKAGIADCFAWSAKLFTIGQYSIYAMQYCEVDADQLRDECFDYCFDRYCSLYGLDPFKLNDDERSSATDYADLHSDDIIEYVVSRMDRNKGMKFEDFLEDYNVNDTHSGNWGYVNGHLVLTDYAGYRIDIIGMAARREVENEDEYELLSAN